jgi:hypothetical protein
MHASLLLLVVFGMPFLRPEPPPTEAPLLLELVTIDEVTTPQAPPTPEPKPEIKAEAPKAAEPEPAKAETPLPPPGARAAPPPPKLALAPPPAPPKPQSPPPAPAPKPAQAAEPPPPPPLPTLEKKPPKSPTPPKLTLATPAPQPKPDTPEPPPQPETKPQPQLAEARAPQMPKVPTPPPEKKFERTMDRIALLLDRSKQEPAPQRQPTPKPQRTAAPVGPQAAAGGQEQRQLTIREIDALVLTIRKQIQQCWIVPAGARDAERLVVKLSFSLNRDGSLARPPSTVDDAQMMAAGGPFYRTAVESARRAVLECTPIRDLPTESYDYWRENTLIFDPREILGQ